MAVERNEPNGCVRALRPLHSRGYPPYWRPRKSMPYGRRAKLPFVKGHCRAAMMVCLEASWACLFA